MFCHQKFGKNFNFNHKIIVVDDVIMMMIMNNVNENHRIINLLSKYFHHQFKLRSNDFIQPNHLTVLYTLHMIVMELNSNDDHDHDDDGDGYDDVWINDNNNYNKFDFDYKYKLFNRLIILLKCYYYPFNTNNHHQLSSNNGDHNNNNNNDRIHQQPHRNKTLNVHDEFELYRLIFLRQPNGQSFRNILLVLCQVKQNKNEKEVIFLLVIYNCNY